MFPTETWKFLQKKTSEFEEVAAMQAGFTFRPIVARRDGDHAGARSVAGEFVSGNYFRTFGLTPHAGRLLADRDDTPGAPLTGVMSYAAWLHDYAGDPAGCRRHILDQHQTGHDRGDRAGGLLWGPHREHAGGCRSVHGGAAGKGERPPQTCALESKCLPLPDRMSALQRATAILTAAGGGIQQLQTAYTSNLRLLMIVSGLVLLIACANMQTCYSRAA